MVAVVVRESDRCNRKVIKKINGIKRNLNVCLTKFFFAVHEERAMVITANEARELHVSQDTPELLAIAKMTDTVEKWIRSCSEHGLKSCHVVIPKWLIGIPVYDPRVVCQGVMSIFEENGFKIDNILTDDANSFTVSWAPGGDM